MLKLIIYKKKACIYLVGGTKEAFSELTFTLNHYFWDIYEGFYHKGKFYSTTDKWETAKIFEELIKEK